MACAGARFCPHPTPGRRLCVGRPRATANLRAAYHVGEEEETRLKAGQEHAGGGCVAAARDFEACFAVPSTCSGDGAGMMTSIPWELLEDFVKGDDIKKSGVGMFFLPQVPASYRVKKA